MRIFILGAGEMGMCLANILKNRHEIILWDKEPSRRNTKENLDDLLKTSDSIIVCVPSSALNNALSDIAPFAESPTPLICLTKGVDPSGKLAPEIIAEVLPRNPFVMMAGPMIAEELNAGMSGYALCAGDQSAYETAVVVFNQTRIALSYTRDTRSVALCSGLKNIYALLMGMIQGLALPENAKGYVAARILEEWGKLSGPLNIDPNIIWGTAGVADFLATGFSAYSYNRTAGEKILKGEKVESEGTRSLAGIVQILNKNNQVVPALLNAVYSIVYQAGNPSEILAKTLDLS